MPGEHCGQSGVFVDEVIVRASAEPLNSVILDAVDAKDGLFQTTVRRVDSLSLTVEQALRDAQVGATTAALRDSAERIAVASDRFATLSDDLELTLERMRDTLDAVRDLSDTLRKDPASVIHGREAKPASKEDSK